VNSQPKVSLLNLSCREASRLISESLDRQLTRHDRWALGLHMLLCSACRKFAHQCQWLRDVLANMPDTLRATWSDNGVTLSRERRAQIQRLLREARQAEAQD
jgi:hypothetical protein